MDLLKAWFQGYPINHICVCIPICTLWFIWKERNDCKMRSIKMNHLRTIDNIIYKIKMLVSVNILGEKNFRGYKFVYEVFNFQIRDSLTTNFIHTIFWQKPSAGIYNLNMDDSL